MGDTELPDIPLGEIIEASTTRFVAQCPRERLNQPPALGTFVRVLPPGQRAAPANETATSRDRVIDALDDPFADPPAFPRPALTALPDGTLFALVGSAATGSPDIGRRASAYGLDEDTLAAEQPQILDLLATHFVALPFASARDGRIVTGLPPRPPRLHAFAFACSPEETRALSEAPDFARRLLSLTSDVPADDLATACLTQAYACRDRDFAFLVRAGKQLAILLRDDPDRLAALLRKLQP